MNCHDTSNPLVQAELSDVFVRYEVALVQGNQEELRDMFWDDPRTLRYGIADRQYGIDEITTWRNRQGPLPPGRRLFDTQITTFGDSAATVNTCFSYPGSHKIGRQSQTWVRFEGGWKIVSAHVSEVPEDIE